MEAVDVLDMMLPGDCQRQIPQFSRSDSPEIVEQFISGLPADIVCFFNSLQKDEKDVSQCLERIKASPGYLLFVDCVLTFYFSRKWVLEPMLNMQFPLALNKNLTY